MICLLLICIVLSAIWVIFELDPNTEHKNNCEQLTLAVYIVVILVITFVILYVRNGFDIFQL